MHVVRYMANVEAAVLKGILSALLLPWEDDSSILIIWNGDDSLNTAVSSPCTQR